MWDAPKHQQGRGRQGRKQRRLDERGTPLTLVRVVAWPTSALKRATAQPAGHDTVVVGASESRNASVSVRPWSVTAWGSSTHAVCTMPSL